jgi:outer membrane protein assembly factor BamE (lipoprotein component of BamABCDE complex)
MAMKRISSIIILVILLTGCMTMGRKIDQAAADKIEKGKTTREQVVSLVGAPDQITRLGNGDMTFTYSYMRATPKAATFIPIIGIFAGGSDVQHQMFIVTFGPDNIVKDLFSTQGASEASMGIASGSGADLPDVEAGKRPR